MVTYWLEGKKTSLASKDISPHAKTGRLVGVEIDKETKDWEPYSSVPGFLNEDLLLDPA